MEAIKAAEPPRNAKELHSFLCTVQYNARFMENYAPQTDFLRDLLKAKVFTWRRQHQEAFASLKEGLSSDTVLVYFDPAAEHEVHVDGCPLGISASLVQWESSDKGCNMQAGPSQMRNGTILNLCWRCLRQISLPGNSMYSCMARHSK